MLDRTSEDAALDRELAVVAAPPRGHPRFPLVDSLRAIAVIGVVLTHWQLLTGGGGRFAPFLSEGRVGVTVFFVISGFLLFRPFIAAQVGLGPKPGFGRYGVNRILRIVPAYWVALTLLWIYPGLVMGPDWPLIYLFGQSLLSGQEFSGIPQAWSLSVEATFYLALPVWVFLLTRLTRGRSARVVLSAHLALALAVIAATLEIRLDTAATLPPSGLEISLPGTAAWFAIGMIVALVSVGAQSGTMPTFSNLASGVGRYPLLCWAVAAGAIVALTEVPSTGEWVRYEVAFVLQSIFALALVLPAIFVADGRGLVRKLLGDPRLRWLGMISYGIFLWHYSVIEKFEDLPGSGIAEDLPGGSLIGSFLITVVIAALSWYVIERPALRIKGRLNGRLPVPRRRGPEPEQPEPGSPEPSRVLP